MAIENSVSNDFGSMFVDTIHVFGCCLHPVPGSGVVLDCINSLYLPSFLFFLLRNRNIRCGHSKEQSVCSSISRDLKIPHLDLSHFAL